MIDDDDRVFAAVRARVESGEYVDDMLGLPGVNIEGGGAFQHADDGQLQRFCHWGSDEYVAARTAGQIQPLPPLAPASEVVVRSCEALLGAPLPRLLRRCYLELGNGGFGPGYGLLGLSEEPATTGTAIGAWLQRQQHWPRPWPPIAASLLPICDWGCAIVSFVDIRDPAGRMWAMDPNPNPGGDLSGALFAQDLTFTEWMSRWAAGSLHQPAIVEDEVTGEWRPATDADYERWSQEL